MQLAVYVPVSGSFAAATIEVGSGIVGNPTPGEDGCISCHYEGALHDSMMGFTEKLMHAAGRLENGSSTIAMGAFRSDEMTRVATYDGTRHVIVSVSNRDLPETWADDYVEDMLGSNLPTGRVDWNDAITLTEQYKLLATQADPGMHSEAAHV